MEDSRPGSLQIATKIWRLVLEVSTTAAKATGDRWKLNGKLVNRKVLGVCWIGYGSNPRHPEHHKYSKLDLHPSFKRSHRFWTSPNFILSTPTIRCILLRLPYHCFFCMSVDTQALSPNHSAGCSWWEYQPQIRKQLVSNSCLIRPVPPKLKSSDSLFIPRKT